MQPNPNRTADFSAVPCGALGFAIFLGLLAAAVLALPAPAQAQDGAEVWGRAGCSTCHGILAEGGDDPAEPTGPSLRITRLDRDLIAEAIAGGRPGTAMPFNLNGAYTEIACYGIPLGEVPAETAGAGGLTAEDLEALMTFLMDNVVGQRRITRENCARFFGGSGNANARACLAYLTSRTRARREGAGH